MLKYLSILPSISNSVKITGHSGYNHDIEITKHSNCNLLYPAPDFPPMDRINCRKRVELARKFYDKLKHQKSRVLKEKVSKFLKSKRLKNYDINQILNENGQTLHDNEQISNDLTDPCFSNPCYNGGSCEAIDEVNFMCYCTHAFFGPLCERHACSNNPCGKHGRCSIDENDLYEFNCDCEEGYSGKICGNYEICSRNKCQNGSVCDDDENGGYLCVCENGFEGRFCERRTDCAYVTHEGDCVE